MEFISAHTGDDPNHESFDRDMLRHEDLIDPSSFDLPDKSDILQFVGTGIGKTWGFDSSSDALSLSSLALHLHEFVSLSQIQPLRFEEYPREKRRMIEKEKEEQQRREIEKEQEKTLKEQILRGYTKQIGSSRFARVTGSATRSFHVQGEVNGHKIDALPDSGAEKCYIKDDLARSLGLTPEAGSACEILLPSKEKIQSPGSVDVEWKFSGESKVYPLKCFVLPIYQHALILGAKVLRQTKTLTNFRNRIKTCIRPLARRFGLHLLDSERERVWGFLDGCQTSALGDFGSDVMAISASYAQRLGLRVNKQFRNRIEVEFADGSSAITAGMVFGVDWMFGDTGTVFKCDFHVLNNLPADVILSNEFLWEQDVFSNYEQYFYNLESSGSPELSLITHIGYFSDKLQSLYEVFRNNVHSRDVLGLDMEEEEIKLRGQIVDEITDLPPEQRKAAWEEEEKRRIEWEEKQGQQSPIPPAPAQQLSASPNPSESIPKPSKVSRLLTVCFRRRGTKV